MARDLTAGMVTEVASTTVRPIVLVKLEFDSGAVRVWNGIGDLSWNAQTWTGVGDLGGVSPVEEAGDLKASGVRFQLSGIPAALISTALSEDYQDRPARMWLGMLDENLNIVADWHRSSGPARPATRPRTRSSSFRATRGSTSCPRCRRR
jgi:hypothetical protein